MGKEKFTETEVKHLKRIGARMKQLRIKAGYKSFETFAYEKGFSRAQYGKYEAGANITAITLIKILPALNVTFEEIFKGFD